MINIVKLYTYHNCSHAAYSGQPNLVEHAIGIRRLIIFFQYAIIQTQQTISARKHTSPYSIYNIYIH